MNRTRSRFPVSCPQGMGNRETAANLLAENDLPSPKAIGQKTASGKQKSARSSHSDSKEPRPIAPPAPLLKIDRVYQAQAGALDALVDVLHLLLVDSPDAHS